MTSFEALVSLLAVALVSIGLALAAYGPERFGLSVPSGRRRTIED